MAKQTTLSMSNGKWMLRGQNHVSSSGPQPQLIADDAGLVGSSALDKEPSPPYSSLPKFQYKPLAEEDDVRLLFVQSVSPSGMTCRLTSTNFATAHRWKYAALSYCWGDGPLDKQVLIDDQIFPVRTSLFDALTAAYGHRTHAEISGAPGCYVWADAICINQADKAEKALQVRQMDKVYTAANEVVIWLGHEEKKSDQAMSLIAWLDLRNRKPKFFEPGGSKPGIFSWIHGSRRKALKALEHSTGREGTNYSLDLSYWTQILRDKYGVKEKTLEALGKLFNHVLSASSIVIGGHEAAEKAVQDRKLREALPGGDDDFWAPFLHLFSRPWFFRIWTFQEVMLSSNATVLCGQHIADWNMFHYARSGLILPFMATSKIIGMTMGLRTLNNEGLLRLIRNGRSYDKSLVGKGVPALHDVLGLDDTSRQASNPKDYIYGFVGIVGRELSKQIVVNYALWDWQVYTNAMQVAIEAEDGTAFWSYTVDRYAHVEERKVHDLPSWCPDFSCQYLRDVIRYSPGPDLRNEALTGLDSIFQSSGVVSGNLRCLTVMGIEIDTIARHCSFVMPPANYPQTSAEELIKPVMQIVTHFETFLQAMRTMLESTNIDGSNWLRDDYLRTIFSFDDSSLGNIERCCKKFRELSDRDNATLLSLMQGLDLDMTTTTDVLVALTNMHGLFQNRRYFVTEAGRLGHAPGKIQPGHRLFYMPGKGASVQLKVLSQQGDRYISSAFVDGLAEDTIIELAKEKDRVQKLTLH